MQICMAVQLLLQEPQFAVPKPKSYTTQPDAPQQMASCPGNWPAVQVVPAQLHCPLLQVFPSVQALVQEPQYWSVVRFTQVPLQQPWPKVQVVPLQLHVLFVQVSPGAQALPHCPQLVTSFVRSLHEVVQHWRPPVQAAPPPQVQ